MRALLIGFVSLILVSALTIPAVSQTKEVQLTGKITCAMCELKVEKECMTVIVAKEGGKDVTYYLDEKSGKANHEAICQAGKEGTVTGILSERAGKKIITASKVEFKK
jgi:hypothetical protein